MIGGANAQNVQIPVPRAAEVPLSDEESATFGAWAR
jgi:hypothetical protein